MKIQRYSSFFFFLAFLTAFSLSLSGCKKDNVDTSSPESIKAAIEDLDLSSVSWAVVKNGEMIWADAVGMASNSLPATTQTRYLAASISKTITAVALMQLYEQGNFGLDDDINNHLPFSVRNPDYPQTPITFRMLLTHTSSISDDHQNTLDLYCYDTDCQASLADFFNDVFAQGGAYYSPDNYSLNSPGQTEDYSNLGNALIGYLVERVSGEAFDSYCDQHIFQPLGMNQTSWRLSQTALSELAHPVSNDLPAGVTHYTFPDYPNGGLRTTPSDLARFLNMFISGGTLEGTQVLTTGSVGEMQSLQNGSQEMCLTFYYETFGGVSMLGHSGGEMGVTTEMYFNPDDGIGVIVFNNDDDARLDQVIEWLYAYGQG